MYNLRVHTDRVSAGTPDAVGVFYSQRSGGPHYRWRLDEGAHPSGICARRFRQLVARGREFIEGKLVEPIDFALEGPRCHAVSIPRAMSCRKIRRRVR